MIKENKLKKFKSLVNKPWKVIVCILLSIVLLNQVISLTTGTNFLSNGFTWLLNSLGIYTEEVPSVTIKSDRWDSGVGGAWKVEKSAKWTSGSTVEVTFDVDTIMNTGDNYKDVIFVLDISGSMEGEKLDKVKSDASELTEYLLSNSNNRVALISFDSTSTILSEFTSDETLILEKINSLTETAATNYNEGLKNVDVVMEGYVKESNRDLVTLFLTDGYPNEDVPNQIATYEILKEKYPYMTINGIQYEMGMDIVQEIKEISDNQFLADIESLNNVLFEASIAPETYESFEIVDYIHKDYFYIESSDDIGVSIGSVVLSEENGVQKITWNLGDNSFNTGKDAEMKIDLKLKEQYFGVDGFYPTNSGEDIKSKLADNKEQTTTSSLTPVLKSSYEVIYDTNPPTGCNIKSTKIETRFIYENVTKKNTELTCPGYIFKGWEIVDTDLSYINDDTFVMPAHDVTIRAVWTKQLISKSMEGTVNVRATLYNVIKDEAKTGTFAKEYNGLDSDTYENKVYYYNGAVTNNNVLFGGFCWQMVRTTDTGGVKMVYNGVPDANGGCNNIGRATELAKTSPFNSGYTSPAYLGYMYNKVYFTQNKKMSSTENMLSPSSISTTYWYADSVDYGNLTSNKYTLVDPYQVTDTTEYANLVGKYTFRNATETYTSSSVYYIVAVNGSTMYYISLSYGNELNYYDYNFTFGDSYFDNGDGTYTINDPVTIKKSEWYENYSNMKKKYVCKNAVDNTCNSVMYVTATSVYDFDYVIDSNIYVYGNSFTYNDDTKEYTLVDTISAWDWSSTYNQLSNNHYTCFENDNKCSTLKYIFYTDSDYAYYINLNDGKSVDDVLNEMLWAEDVNTIDSDIKTTVETWFEANMLEYEQYLEDTIYCNDRNAYILNGWDPNGGTTTDRLRFYSDSYYYGHWYNIGDLTCKYETDKFTKSTENGNGKLKYPVALLTAGEVSLARSNDDFYGHDEYYLQTNSSYWILSPLQYEGHGASGYFFYLSGNLGQCRISNSAGVRPAISLRFGTEYYDGDGSADNPYVVYLDS